MKKLLLASSALVFAGSAFAADLPARAPVKAPFIAAVPYTWTGCYFGGHAGAGWGHTDFSDPGSVPLGGGPPVQNIADPGSSIGVNGKFAGLGGVQAGCDYQFANNWVIGIAGDYSWSDIHGFGNDPFFAGKNSNIPLTLFSKTDRLATITGRVGHTWDHLLFYGKGGAASARDRYSLQNLDGLSQTDCFSGAGPGPPIACNPKASATRWGWTAGIGVEWAFANSWSTMIEYDHYGFGSKTVSFTDPNAPGAVALLNVKQSFDVVKVGINYRFGH